MISDKPKFPGSFFQGKEISRPDRQTTGLLFLNDEGTEMGGLIFDGAKGKDGQVRSNGHLSFDQYDQDQISAVDAGQDGSDKRTRSSFQTAAIGRSTWRSTRYCESRHFQLMSGTLR